MKICMQYWQFSSLKNNILKYISVIVIINSHVPTGSFKTGAYSVYELST